MCRSPRPATVAWRAPPRSASIANADAVSVHARKKSTERMIESAPDSAAMNMRACTDVTHTRRVQSATGVQSPMSARKPETNVSAKIAAAQRSLVGKRAIAVTCGTPLRASAKCFAGKSPVGRMSSQTSSRTRKKCPRRNAAIAMRISAGTSA